MNAARALPSRGLEFGAYPQRAEPDDDAALVDMLRMLRSRFGTRTAVRLPDGIAAAMQAANKPLRTMPPAAFDRTVDALRVRLRREGLSDGAAGAAFAVAAEALQRTLGKTPYETQVLAAWLMLTGRLVEMATGEGKTLAAALAAAVAGLGGAPVHVLTANDYLVRRDRDSLEPFYTALGLTSDCVVAAMSRDERAVAWRRDIVYASAREVAFDYLRDHLTLGGERDARVLRARELASECDLDPPVPRVTGHAGAAPIAAAQPVLPGLCLCLVDEADSILLDEAVVPLILAAPTRALDAQAYRRAYDVSCTLQRGRDYALVHARRVATLTQPGRTRVAAAVAGATGLLWPTRRACELVESALAARLLYRRDREYTVTDGQLQLIDELTGRIAQGRQWQGALHPMVEVKEGLEPSAPTATSAQITYQRFFPRYLKLGGMSGTLLETRHELRVLYDAPVQRVPLAKPDRRRRLGERCYVDAAHKWRAVLQAVRSISGAGRPVLVGTDSVADSAHLSALLHANGIGHQLLNAAQDADEAERIARAGEAGMVTVATNIAGRGTDIRLDAQAAAAGGLHVIAAMRNRSRRIDRQLIGRCARHGDSGSAEALLALDDTLLRRTWPGALLVLAARFAGPRGDGTGAGRVPGWLSRPLFAIAQRHAEWNDRAHRRQLRRADQHAALLYGFAGGTE